MRKISTFLLIMMMFVLSSCSLFSKNDEKRKLQTNILTLLNSNAGKFAKCAKKSELFKILKQDRARVVMLLSIRPNGQVESFKLDNSEYPAIFTECIFNIIDLLSFPKNNLNKIVELEQPFIFSNK
jgi:hypothetical protein